MVVAEGGELPDGGGEIVVAVEVDRPRDAVAADLDDALAAAGWELDGDDVGGFADSAAAVDSRAVSAGPWRGVVTLQPRGDGDGAALVSFMLTRHPSE